MLDYQREYYKCLKLKEGEKKAHIFFGTRKEIKNYCASHKKDNPRFRGSKQEKKNFDPAVAYFLDQKIPFAKIFLHQIRNKKITNVLQEYPWVEQPGMAEYIQLNNKRKGVDLYKLKNTDSITEDERQLVQRKDAWIHAKTDKSLLERMKTDETMLFVPKEVALRYTPRDGLTPLLYATAKGFTNSIIALLESGASVNVCDKRGQTALHYALPYAQYKAATVLVKYGIADKRILLFNPNALGKVNALRYLAGPKASTIKQDWFSPYIGAIPDKPAALITRLSLTVPSAEFGQVEVYCSEVKKTIDATDRAEIHQLRVDNIVTTRKSNSETLTTIKGKEWHKRHIKSMAIIFDEITTRYKGQIINSKEVNYKKIDFTHFTNITLAAHLSQQCKDLGEHADNIFIGCSKENSVYGVISGQLAKRKTKVTEKNPFIIKFSDENYGILAGNPRYKLFLDSVTSNKIYVTNQKSLSALWQVAHYDDPSVATLHPDEKERFASKKALHEKPLVVAPKLAEPKIQVVEEKELARKPPLPSKSLAKLAGVTVRRVRPTKPNKVRRKKSIKPALKGSPMRQEKLTDFFGKAPNKKKDTVTRSFLGKLTKSQLQVERPRVKVPDASQPTAHKENSESKRRRLDGFGHS